MSNKTKRSVIIDISPDDQSASKSKALLLTSAILVIIGCAVFYLKQSTDTDRPPALIEAKDPPQSQTSNSKIRPQTPPAQSALPTKTATPLPTAAPETTESQTVVAINPKRSYDDYAAIIAIARPLLQHSSNTQTISGLQAIELQLKVAREQQHPALTIELLEDKFVEQLTHFTYEEINAPLQSTAAIIQQNHLDTYAAVQWSEFQKAHQEAHRLLQSSAHLQALNTLKSSQHTLQEFKHAATTLLQSMAVHATQSSDINSAKTNYQSILRIDPENQQANTFLHQHAFPAGATTTGPNDIKLAFIPAGQFERGSPSNEFSRDSDERAHTVTLSRSIYISTTEITQAQWKSVMGSMPEQFPTDGANIGSNQPIHSLSWHEADAFCKRLNQLQPEANYRLPTEAEWEYACRAGSATAYNNERAQLPAKAANTFNPSNPSNHDHAIEVASYTPNTWGLYDMHGNLWEWTNDWKGPYPADAAVDPSGVSAEQAGDSNLRMKILRGGSYYDDASMARSANRWESSPSIAADYIGFRIVRESAF